MRFRCNHEFMCWDFGTLYFVPNIMAEKGSHNKTCNPPFFKNTTTYSFTILKLLKISKVFMKMPQFCGFINFKGAWEKIWGEWWFSLHHERFSINLCSPEIFMNSCIFSQTLIFLVLDRQNRNHGGLTTILT